MLTANLQAWLVQSPQASPAEGQKQPAQANPPPKARLVEHNPFDSSFAHAHARLTRSTAKDAEQGDGEGPQTSTPRIDLAHQTLGLTPQAAFSPFTPNHIATLFQMMHDVQPPPSQSDPLGPHLTTPTPTPTPNPLHAQAQAQAQAKTPGLLMCPGAGSDSVRSSSYSTATSSLQTPDGPSVSGGIATQLLSLPNQGTIAPNPLAPFDSSSPIYPGAITPSRTGNNRACSATLAAADHALSQLGHAYSQQQQQQQQQQRQVQTRLQPQTSLPVQGVGSGRKPDRKALSARTNALQNIRERAAESVQAGARKKKNSAVGQKKAAAFLAQADTLSVAAAVDVPDEKADFLQRNKEAALRCRQRKKAYLEGLESEAARLAEENEQLRMTTISLREEMATLKAMLKRSLGRRRDDRDEGSSIGK